MNVERGYFQQLVLGIVVESLCWESTLYWRKKKSSTVAKVAILYSLTKLLCLAEILIER